METVSKFLEAGAELWEAETEFGEGVPDFWETVSEFLEVMAELLEAEAELLEAGSAPGDFTWAVAVGFCWPERPAGGAPGTDGFLEEESVLTPDDGGGPGPPEPPAP